MFFQYLSSIPKQKKNKPEVNPLKGILLNNKKEQITDLNT